jgi:hypothetical protein
LTRAEYLEHFQKPYLSFPEFWYTCTVYCPEIITEVDFLTKEGLQWLSDNMFTDTIEMKGQKEFTEERNISLLLWYNKVLFLSDGQLYKQINSIIEG